MKIEKSLTNIIFLYLAHDYITFLYNNSALSPFDKCLNNEYPNNTDRNL